MAIWHDGTLDLEALNRLGADCMNGFLGIRFIAFDQDLLTAEMPVNARTRQPYGLLHGGASVALAETISSVAGTHTLDPGVRRVVGMEINANHIRPAASGMVRAIARAEALGRTTQVWTIRIVDEGNKLICLSRATLAILPADRSTRQSS